MGLTVEVTRGPAVESVHAARACLAAVDGRILDEASIGDATWPTYLRSAAKPFQAAPAAAADVMGRLGLSTRHLTIGCASHDGSPGPVRLVREILDASGLDEFAVRAGDDGQGGLLKHQCSGNHALVLAWCVTEGWPTDTYLHRDHPAQVAMLDAVSAACGAEVATGPDGCGMTAYRVSLGAAATAYARLAVGWDGLPGLDAVAAAMRAHPVDVSGPGKGDAELMVADPALVAKYGVESLVGIGSSADGGRGVAVRIVDGSPRAWGPAAVAATRRWLAPDVTSDGLAAVERPPVLDGGHRPVGELRAVWS